MLLSNTQPDFEKIFDANHIELLRKDMNLNTPKFFKEITDKNRIENNSPDASDTIIWNTLINKAIKDYDKESNLYRSFFSEEQMEDFEEEDNPQNFKSNLKRNCPVIRKTLNSKLEELQKWQEDFAYSKPQELLDTFANFLDFAREYIEIYDENKYKKLDKLEDFIELSKITEDEKYYLHNVIGTGIITTVLYNLEARVFHKSVKRTLIGMYFLTINSHRFTPSKTSEFVIIDDTYKRGRGAKFNFKIDHNYWYPYDLFMFYSNHIFKILIKLFNDIHIDIDYRYRYIYLELFLNQIIKLKQDAVKTMLGTDQEF